MCGICGVVYSDPEARVDVSVLGQMVETLHHRGPDDRGTFVRSTVNPAVGLGHARLSIIDVAGGHQPMSNEDGSIVIVFNGEIYNFPALRDELTRRGHVFRTRSDTEVIVHLYEENGADCLAELRGMFALAIWDEPRQRLFLARDRLGQKPLCYHHDGRRFLFGSEMKAILAHPQVPREVDEVALHHYLTYQYVASPRTMFRAIRRLPPAHFLIWEKGEVRLERYWDLRPDPRPMDEKQCADELRGRLEEATQMRLISDVPLGAFLSGGVDSTIVVGLMSRLCREPVRTFSIGFAEKAFNELAYARLAAEKFGTQHQEFTVEPKAIEVLPKLIWHYNEPFADASAVPTYYVSQMTSEHVKVALTGDAGDECFAGYDRYRAVRLGEWCDRIPRFIRAGLAAGIGCLIPGSSQPRSFRRRLKRFLQALRVPRRQRYLNWIGYFRDEEKARLYTDDFQARLGSRPSVALLDPWYDRAPPDDFLGATLFVDLMTYLPEDLLVKVDIAGMANSLETRSPFLDHQVVEFAATIPTRLKLKGRTSKYILKQAFRDLLPEPIARRSKMGFGVPVAAWFRGELTGFLQETLLSSRADRGYFRPEAVERLVGEHLSGRFDHASKLWALLNFELWARMFLDREEPAA